jgi:hypothetical protein
VAELVGLLVSPGQFGESARHIAAGEQHGDDCVDDREREAAGAHNRD